MRVEYLIFGMIVILLGGAMVFAYSTNNPPVFGHSANEIEVVNSAVGPVYTSVLTHYISNSQNPFTSDSGTITNISSYSGFSIPGGAKEVLLNVRFFQSSSSVAPVEVGFKYPGHSSFKKSLVSPDGTIQSESKYFWIPLNFQGVVEWEINHLSANPDVSTTLSIQGYR